jgi:hypothetical protein
MEYLHAITYILLVGDNLYQIQHTSLASKSVEEYLTWLLRDRTELISKDQFVELQAEFDREQVGSDLGGVMAVEIGGFVPETVKQYGKPEISLSELPEKMIEVEHRESIGDKIAQTFHSAKQILVDLLGEVEAQKIIESTPPEAALEVKVSIGYRAKRRKFQKEFMRDLASGLRHLPDGQLRVRGRDGLLKGDDARLSSDMSVRRVGSTSSLLDLEDARRQMLEVHRRFLHDGRIAV